MAQRLRLDVHCVGKKSLSLIPGETARIGRGEGMDLVLEKGDVSRHHCDLAWDEGDDRPAIYDNDSANGVLLNGKRVDLFGYISDGAVVEIGGSVLNCSLVRVERRTNCASERFNLGDSSGEFLIDHTGPSVKGEFAQNAELVTALLELERTNRTGTVVIETPNGDDLGGITLARGRAMDAHCGDMRGLEAFELLSGLAAGGYRLTPICKPSELYLDISFKQFFAD